VLIIRILEYILPFRVMPMFDPHLAFKAPYGFTASQLEDLRRSNMVGNSSFPSDHAGLFFALATGLYLTYRRLGIIAFAYVLVVVLLPRIYVGRHYPSDILAGGLLGVGFAYLMTLQPLRKKITHPVFLWHQRSPATFYAFFFLLSYEIGFLFGDVRILARLLLSALHGG
jgi:membrane-associated phospholipid phosphatase